jgi:nucleoid DNA-binding protein
MRETKRKSDISEAIYQELNETITKNECDHVTDIIINFLEKEIVSGQMVSVGNFGTLSMYKRKEKYVFRNIKTKQKEEYVGKIGVKFYPAETFKRLLREKIEKFKTFPTFKKPVDKSSEPG